MISSLTVYLTLILDSIHGLLTTISTLGILYLVLMVALASFISLICYSTDDIGIVILIKDYVIKQKTFNFCILGIIILSSFLNASLPTTKQMVMIYLVPKVG